MARHDRPGTRGLGVAAVALTSLLAAAGSEAGRILYLVQDELLCDQGETACIIGTLSYEVNERLLWLHGRVRFAPGPGMFQITLTGTTRLGWVRYAPMEIMIRGRPSEIVDFRMLPDHPDVYEWQIDRIKYVPEPET